MMGSSNKTYNKDYYEKNKERIRLRTKLYYQANKSKMKKAHRKYAASHEKELKIYKEKYRTNNSQKMATYRQNYNLIGRYGISTEQYESLLSAQKGACAICTITKCATGKRLAVDHCHSTQKIRGLLCARCNLLIGAAQESNDILNATIKYLNDNKITVQKLDQQPNCR